MPEPHVTLNALSEAEARATLAHCCAATRWVGGMLARRPWGSTAALLADADAIWADLSRADLLEAFAGHPRIGAGGTDRWSRQEQAGASHADAEMLRRLREANEQYWSRFGYIFIVCATGKSAPEMLGLLEARLANDPERELTVAAAEGARITRLRLEKLGT